MSRKKTPKITADREADVHQSFAGLIDSSALREHIKGRTADIRRAHVYMIVPGMGVVDRMVEHCERSD